MDQFDNNKKIIEQFELLKKQIRYDIEFSTDKRTRSDTFRLAAVEKVIEILKKYDKEIKSVDQLQNIKGIGPGSLDRIDEILRTGKLKEIKITKNIDKYLSYIENLEQIHGIGKRTAYNLFKNHNIKSVEDLQKAFKEGKIDLPEVVIKYLSYFGKIKDTIPREDIDRIKGTLIKTSLEVNEKLICVICGSYRRQKPTSNDIDVLIFHTGMVTKEDIENSRVNYLKAFVSKLKDKGIIVDSLTSDDVHSKYMGIATVYGVLRRIDIRYLPYGSYFAAILYFTGGKEFNRTMRSIALSMDYTLNEYGLFNEKGKMIHVSSEKEIFDILGMEYVPPEKR